METLLGGQEAAADHYHDPSEHGFLWALLNELLHVIVFGYTLHGMIQFKVKFISKHQLARYISVLFVAHSWYLTVKFAAIAIVIYLFNDELEARSISWSDYNCSLANHAAVFRFAGAAGARQANVHGPVSQRLKYMSDFLHLQLDTGELYARLLDSYGGPFKWLANRATLMYGFYSIAFFVMLAVFPIEQMYLHKVDFNYIRFVLSDPSCMSELYANRRRHLERLASWSRNQTDSELTLGTKIALNRRDLRSLHADDCNQLAVQMVMANMAAVDRLPHLHLGRQPRAEVAAFGTGEAGREFCARTGASSRQLTVQKSRLANAEFKLTANLKSLRNRFMSTNHLDRPSYPVQVAWRNLCRFKPYVRSKSWFKLSMILYPSAIFFYFALVVAIVSATSMFFVNSLAEIVCDGRAEQLFEGWSPLDYLTYMETQYTVYAISCASSFYCSYYFGTVAELHVWTLEVSQQLSLCKIIVELAELNHSADYHKYLLERRAETNRRRLALLGGRQQTSDSLSDATETTGAGHLLEQRYYRKRIGAAGHKRANQFVGCVNEFGGFDCLAAHANIIGLASQSQKFKTYEQMAFELLDKKQTLLRATYINMCLFLDELSETRFMTQTILRRTTLIAFGFALLASITRSQFQANYWHLTILLACSLIILNFYLIYAAVINSSVNKLLVQIHSLISASLRAGSEDADLFEFWVRHIRSFGEGRDVASYKIYGYKITWATILNSNKQMGNLSRPAREQFDSAVCTAYFYSIY